MSDPVLLVMVLLSALPVPVLGFVFWALNDIGKMRIELMKARFDALDRRSGEGDG